MSRREPVVTLHEPDLHRLPDCLTEAAVLLMELYRRGLVANAAEKLKIRRQGGYAAVDIWLMLLVYFTSLDAPAGIRPFWEKTLRPVCFLVAALAGRRKLASPASVSRALGSVELDLLRPVAPWLLLDATGVEDVARHPAMMSYDAHGVGWHVFDLDPTVTTFRQRDLPGRDEEDDDLPEPMRRAEGTGEPGYSGRKRGDIQFQQVAACHAGSGAWVHAHLSPGNGEGVADGERAFDAILATALRLDHPPERTLVRVDGVAGNVPWMTAARERGLVFLTRLNRAALFEDPEVLQRLRDATWHLVEDSGSGPRRSAADLGVVTLKPDKKTRRPDGRRYDPIEVRVVASIFPKMGEAKRGRTIDGWQVELFATDLPADAWPAEDTVTAYFGRNTLENRFAQEDRETKLDRVLSYERAGQELAVLVGLSTWNMRLARGFALEPLPAVRPVQTLRQPRVDDRVPACWPRDPVVAKLLGGLDWTELLGTARWAGWRYDDGTAELRCPDDRPLALTTVRKAEGAEGHTGIIFRRPKGGCEACEARDDCLRSERPEASKHAELSVPTEVAKVLRERLARVRARRRGSTEDPEPGLQAVRDSLFLPARARQAYDALFRRASLRVEVEIPEAPPLLELLAEDAGDRQRRRKTWAQNAARYELPDGAMVRVRLEADDALRAALGHGIRHADRAAGPGEAS